MIMLAHSSELSQEKMIRKSGNTSCTNAPSISLIFCLTLHICFVFLS